MMQINEAQIASADSQSSTVTLIAQIVVTDVFFFVRVQQRFSPTLIQTVPVLFKNKYTHTTPKKKKKTSLLES